MKKKKEHVALCVHAFKDVDFDVYLNHLVCLRQWMQDATISFAGKKGLQAATARNAIIEDCFSMGCDYAFFVDADHLMPPEALRLLLENKDEAITSGLVCKKGENFQQVGWVVKDGLYYDIDLPLDGRLYEVGVCAFGCTLINLNKLKKLEKPYFRDTCEKNVKGDLSNIRSDVNLCNAFRNIKERCFIDTRVLVGHHGFQKTVYPQNCTHFSMLNDLELDSRRLKLDQKGFFYE